MVNLDNVFKQIEVVRGYLASAKQKHSANYGEHNEGYLLLLTIEAALQDLQIDLLQKGIRETNLKTEEVKIDEALKHLDAVSKLFEFLS